MENPISADLLRFIEANIGSVEQLEILRVLGESPERSRTATELSRECQCKPSEIDMHLAALRERGLLRMQQQESQILYIHGGGSNEKDELLVRLLQCYRERPVTLIKLAYARGDERLRALAEAFQIGKGK